MNRSSILLTNFSTPFMTELVHGQSGKLYYSVMMALGGALAGRTDVNSGAVIYRVDLPFATKVHLVGVPKLTMDRLDPSTYDMEKVVLEGDFPNYFSLYAESGMQAESRYVLDPAAMQYVVDFCGSHYWEIMGDQLIFMHPNDLADHDSADVMTAANGFIDQIRPAIELPISPERQLQRAPYGQERRILQCPLCHDDMKNEDRYSVCPQGHGILAYGSILADLRGGISSIALPTVAPIAHDDHLHCPSCHNEMKMTPYNATNMIIDTCIRCPYRWLDADEVAGIHVNERIERLNIGRSQDGIEFTAPSHPDSGMTKT